MTLSQLNNKYLRNYGGYVAKKQRACFEGFYFNIDLGVQTFWSFCKFEFMVGCYLRYEAAHYYCSTEDVISD